MALRCTASNQVSAFDLHERLLEHKYRHQKSYTIVQERCYDRISRCARVAPHQQYCAFEVPAFIIGRPPYDVGRCIELLMASLRHNGYHVEYRYPRTLHVTWDLSALRPRLPPMQLLHGGGGGSERGAVPDANVILPPPSRQAPPPRFRPISEFRPSARLMLSL